MRKSHVSSLIWANYNNSLIWIQAIWGWFPLLTMISRVRSQWARYNLPRLIHGKLPPFFHPLNIDEENTRSLRSLRSSRYHPHRSSRRAAVNPPGHRCFVGRKLASVSTKRAQKKKRAGKCAWSLVSPCFTMFHPDHLHGVIIYIYLYKYINMYNYIYIY